MKKLYSTIMMLAMIVALSSSTCSGSSDDDDDVVVVEENSLVGVWELVSIDMNPSTSVNLEIGDKLYFNSDGTYKDKKQEGLWILKGNFLYIISNNNSVKSDVVEVVKMTSKELIFKYESKKVTVTFKFKRLS